MKSLQEFLVEARGSDIFRIKERYELRLWSEFALARQKMWKAFEESARKELVGKNVSVNGKAMLVHDVIVRKNLDATVPSPFEIMFDVLGNDLESKKIITVTVSGGHLKNRIFIMD
jgi:hypothetical protein